MELSRDDSLCRIKILMKQSYILNNELMLTFLQKRPLRRIGEKASWISPTFLLTRKSLYLDT